MASLFQFIENALSRQDDSIANRRRRVRYEMLEDQSTSGFNFDRPQINAVNENIEGIISYLVEFERQIASLEKVEKEIDEIQKYSLAIRQAELDEAKRSKRTSAIIRAQANLDRERERLTNLQQQQLDLTNERLELDDRMLEPIIEKMRKVYGLTQSQIDEILDTFKNKNIARNYRRISADANRAADAIVQEQNIRARRNERVERLLSQDGLGSVTNFVKTITQDLGLFGIVVRKLLGDLIKTNTLFVQFNRSMSLGLSSNMLLDSDLYGNNNQIGITNIKRDLDISNLEFEDFMKSFQAFSKGNILGVDSRELINNSKNLQQFGKTTALLTKQYGVEIGNLNAISESLFYNYGASIQDINNILSDGRKIALNAGVSVKGYYENLKQATDALGEFYIADGTRGLEQLALAASKLGLSTSQLLNITGKYKDFTSQFEIQGKAMALGMRNFSEASRAIWGLTMTGQRDKAVALEVTSQLKDFRSMGAFDNEGNLNQVGMMTSQALGLSKEQIQTLTRLNKKYDDLNKRGFTLEEITGLKPIDPARQKEIEKYEQTNATISERFNMAMSKIFKLFAGLERVMTPIIDLGLGLFNMFGDLASVVGDFLMPGFKIIGNVLGAVKDAFLWVADKVSKFANWLGGINKTMTEGKGVMSKFLKAVSVAGAALMTYALLPGRRGIIGSLINMISGGGRTGLLRTLVRGRGIGRNVLNSGRGLLSNIGGRIRGMPRGVLRGAGIAGVAGNLLGGMVGGEGGNTISNISTGASIGAMLGSIIPGVGTAVGAIAGGIGGVLVSAGDRISKVWEEENLSVGKKLGRSFGAVINVLSEAWTALKGWVKNVATYSKDLFTNLGKDKAESLQTDMKFAEAIVNFFGDVKTGFEDERLQKGVEQGVINANKQMQQQNYYNSLSPIKNSSYLTKIDDIMNKRRITVDKGQATQEREEERRKENINITVNANSSIYSASTKARIQMTK